MKIRLLSKEKTANVALIAVAVLTLLAVAYGFARCAGTGEISGGPPAAAEEEDVYRLGGHDLAEFSQPILEEFGQESKLVVSEVDAEVSVELKQTGLFDIGVLNKSQDVTYRGTCRFYVDLSALGQRSIRLDDQNAVITIEIPHTKLEEIEIDPDRFTFGETEKGLLAFGDLRFTAREYNDLEVACKQKIRSAVSVEENYQKADEMAVAEMKKIYEPIVKAVDSTYRVEIEFIQR